MERLRSHGTGFLYPFVMPRGGHERPGLRLTAQGRTEKRSQKEIV